MYVRTHTMEFYTFVAAGIMKIKRATFIPRLEDKETIVPLKTEQSLRIHTRTRRCIVVVVVVVYIWQRDYL